MLRALSLCCSIILMLSGLEGFFSVHVFPFLVLAPVFDFPIFALTLSIALFAGWKKVFRAHFALNLIGAALLVFSRNGPSLVQHNYHHSGKSVVIFDLNVGQFGNNEKNVNYIIQTINSLKPDIVCLQEFGLYDRWPNVQSVAEDFSSKIGLKYLDCTPHKGNIFCSALFSRYPIANSDTIFQLLSHTNEAKSYEILIGDKSLRLINAHFQSFNLTNRSSGDKLSVLSVIRKQIKQFRLTSLECKNHAIDLIVGDFNTPPGNNLFPIDSFGFKDAQVISGRGLVPTYQYFPIRLDRALVKSQIKVCDYRIICDVPSDHMAMVFKIEI